MGTSSRNLGQSGHSPLVPSWVDDEGEGNVSVISTPMAPNADPDRFSEPRGNMTRFARNGNTDNFERAVSQYVTKSIGGTHNAVQRLGTARRSTAILFGAVGSFYRNGAAGTQEFLKTYSLIGKNADEALISITDIVCSDGGTTNEGIVRDAYIDTIAETAELRMLNFEELQPEQMLLILQGCIARVVIGKILNDIGNKLIVIPESLQNVKNLKKQMILYVEGVVKDSFTRLNIHPDSIHPEETQELTNSVYEQIYSIFAEDEE